MAYQNVPVWRATPFLDRCGLTASSEMMKLTFQPSGIRHTSMSCSDANVLSLYCLSCSKSCIHTFPISPWNWNGDWDYGSVLGFSEISLIGGIHEWNHPICYGSQALQQWTLVGTQKSIDFSVQAQCLPDVFLGKNGQRCIKNSRAITLKILRIIVNQIGNCDLCQPLTVCTGVYSESCSITLISL